MPTKADIRITSGFDQTLTVADRLESYTPASGKTTHVAQYGDLYVFAGAVPEYSPGERRFSAAGGNSYGGRKQMIYVCSRVQRDTVADLESNLEGQVTARLTERGSTYATFNAYLRLDYQPDQIGATLDEWGKLRLIFSIFEEL